jgi:hypothetical protein
MPTSDAELSVTIRGAERADWLRAQQENNTAAYQRYLRDYPSGRWKKHARVELERLEWEAARHQDTVRAYRRYLGKHPTGSWRSEAETAVTAIVERTPDRIEREALDQLMLGGNENYRKRAVAELIRRGATEDVAKVLADQAIFLEVRQGILAAVVKVATAWPERAEAAHLVLCTFASSSPWIEVPGTACATERSRSIIIRSDALPLSFPMDDDGEYIPFTLVPGPGRTHVMCDMTPARECVTLNTYREPAPISEQVEEWKARVRQCEQDARRRIEEAERGLRAAARSAAECSQER